MGVDLRTSELRTCGFSTLEERYAYEESLKRMRDSNNVLNYAKDVARAEGRAEGFAEGMEKGIEEGTLKVARNMKAAGVDVGIIADTTGLSNEEIECL